MKFRKKQMLSVTMLICSFEGTRGIAEKYMMMMNYLKIICKLSNLYIKSISI